MPTVEAVQQIPTGLFIDHAGDSKGAVVAEIPTCFNTITIRAQPTHIATPSKKFIDEQAMAVAKLFVAAPKLFSCLLAYVELEESSAPSSSSPLRERARNALFKAGY